jgi:hypothetical protein
MKDISLNLSSNTNDLLFKPEVIALEHFGTMPSYIQLTSMEIPLSYIKRVIETSPKIYKAYENINIHFAKYIDKMENIMDRFVVFNNSKSFNTTKNKENDIVLYFHLESESIPVILGKEPFYIDSTILIYYDANKTSDDDIKNVLTDIFKYCKIDDEEYIDNNSYISLVTKDSNGSLNTKEFAIKDPKINLALSYGEEFKEIDKTIFKGLKKSDKGIWIFHGPPGTGKSMYIRNLIKRLNKLESANEVIYMSSEMIASLESPDFLPFIQNYKDSVLVIEDADIALESRKSHGSIVKTVLQLTDGILADCLRLKIIATFNCELSQIDEALLRKGRLQYRHEFRHLTKDEAVKLGASLKLGEELFNTDEYKNKGDWTLAEIYNIKQDFHWDRKKSRMGFNFGK